MKRRGFLGFMGGAAVAAPHAAKAAIAELPNGLSNSLSMPIGAIGGYPTQGASIGADTGWRLSEIKRLKALITGELSDEDKRRIKQQRLYRAEREISEGIACLVSVSGGQKLKMYSDRLDKHQERIMREEAKSQLFWLERQD